MDNNSKKQISRRDFLKIAGAAGVTTAGLAACNDGKNTAGAENNIDGKPGQMTYRTNPKTGEKVSLLGFGMMRLPFTEKNAEGQEEIDQEMVNELVDYAFKHGVNYFDTSPAYCRGLSERATGIALARYPRDKYFIATKLSNFAPSTRTREASMEMYHNSLKYLQTDYIDYMLLHSVGGGSDSMAEYEERYINNGILDFLIKEREAGRIRNIGFSYHGDIRVFDRLLSEHDKYKWDFVQIQLNYLDWRYAKQINESNTNAEYLYNELAKRFGAPSYNRLQAAATSAQKAALSKLSPEMVSASTLAGDPITARLTAAPGNGASIGGLKVMTDNGWFAARPSGTEDAYKIYCESFLGEEHRKQIEKEAVEIVSEVLKNA